MRAPRVNKALVLEAQSLRIDSLGPNPCQGLVLAALLILTACAPSDDSTVVAPEIAALAEAYTLAWNSGDPAQVASFYATDGVLTINGGTPAEGRAAVEVVARSFMEAFPDMRLSQRAVEKAGDRIRYHWTFEGTNSGPPGTGNRVLFSGYEAWSLNQQGQVQDSLGNFDAADYQRQLYAHPEALLAMGLTVFPADRSLARAEDGVALEDGSLLVVDQIHGLRKLAVDGSSAPFGKMTLTGYRHDPPNVHGGANGISLEPAGTHVLVADIFGGGIYRVALADGQTAKLYQHGYGVNTAVRDSTGAIWFTQSAHNRGEETEALMWAAVDRPLRQGALQRLGVTDGRLDLEPTVVLDGLQFANGIAIDESSGALYLAETTGQRVWRYDLNVEAGALSEGRVLKNDIFVDNLELDQEGRLWIAAPLPNNVLIVDPVSEEERWLLPEPSPERAALGLEWSRRGEAGESRMSLLTPDAWAPMPGFITGVIHGAEDGQVYLSGLTNALLAVTPIDAE